MAEIEVKDLISGDGIYAPSRIENVVDQKQKLGWKVSCKMFKSESLYAADRKASFSNYIRAYVEAANGAHYYARSFDTSTYQSTSCTIPLAKCKMNDPRRKRAGCISIGICTENAKLYYHFDVGLRNLRGEGWHPMIWGRGFVDGWNPAGPTADKPNLIHHDDAQVPIQIVGSDPIVNIPGDATVTLTVLKQTPGGEQFHSVTIE